MDMRKVGILDVYWDSGFLGVKDGIIAENGLLFHSFYHEKNGAYCPVLLDFEKSEFGSDGGFGSLTPKIAETQ